MLKTQKSDERFFASRGGSYRVRHAYPDEVLLYAQHHPLEEGSACYAAVQWSPFPFIIFYAAQEGLVTEMSDAQAREVFMHYAEQLAAADAMRRQC